MVTTRRAMGDSRAAHVAVVGGGISGLVFARELSVRGIRATVFDTGEKAVGGRASTREAVDDLGRALSWDHACQYFTATPGSVFESMAREWHEVGLIGEWPDANVGVLDASSGMFVPFRDGATRYVGVGGLKKLTTHLADCENVTVVRPKWVGAMTPTRDGTDETSPVRWNLASSPGSRGEQLGTFDFVAVAHNGKCAARLASTAQWADGTGAVPKLTQSLQCAFGARPTFELKKQRKLILSSVWALMVAFDESLMGTNDSMQGAHVTGSDTIAWVSNVTAKRALSGGHASTPSPSSTVPECWVVHSTPTYARDNKCPQEAVPKQFAEKVQTEMLAEFERILGLPPGTAKPSTSRVQLWGAANPLTSANVPAVFDASGKVGACGDWCQGPPSIEAAAISAVALADAVEALFRKDKARVPDAASILDATQVRWSPCGGAAALGAFPGTEVPAMAEPKEKPKETSAPGGGRGRGGGKGRGKAGGRGRGGRSGGGGGGGRGKKAAVVSAVARGRVAMAFG